MCGLRVGGKKIKNVMWFIYHGVFREIPWHVVFIRVEGRSRLLTCYSTLGGVDRRSTGPHRGPRALSGSLALPGDGERESELTAFIVGRQLFIAASKI